MKVVDVRPHLVRLPLARVAPGAKRVKLGQAMTRVLGIETSCDETSAAVLDGRGDDVHQRSLVILSQDIHRVFGGVVPEIASRAHLTSIVPVVERALVRRGDIARRASISSPSPKGPGLVGALLVGVAYGKALAYARGIPVVGVHHMEGHLFATSLEHADAVPPFTALLISGGHTLLLDVAAWGDYRVLGSTRDDAAGEAFDKIAKLLGMPYPGGPHIERAAATGDPTRFRFSRPMVRTNSRPGDGDYYDLSFSGLKTAVRLATQKVDVDSRACESCSRLSGCADRHARGENAARRTRKPSHARRARAAAWRATARSSPECASGWRR